MLRDLVPNAKRMGLLVNPNNPNADAEAYDAVEAAKKRAGILSVFKAGTLTLARAVQTSPFRSSKQGTNWRATVGTAESFERSYPRSS